MKPSKKQRHIWSIQAIKRQIDFYEYNKVDDTGCNLLLKAEELKIELAKVEEEYTLLYSKEA